ncbi:MAG TPA: hypothetical protein VFC24_18700 [Casimicrobiaceae bacterium]|nr:hypothetical protein [Casimicrobiaceae bacterium]
MKPASRRAPAPETKIVAPLVWTFDGPFARCLAEMEDALRRAIVQLGGIGAVAVLIELSLPALKDRVDAHEVIQPAWSDFLERLSRRYGLPAAPRVRYVRTAAPLATLVVAYRS